MNRLFTAKPLLAAAVALGAVGAASAAHAQTDVVFSVGVPASIYVPPPQVYMAPPPVYEQPAPEFFPQPVYVQPSVTYYGYDRWHDRRRYDEARREGWREGWRGGDHDHDRAPSYSYRR